MDFENLPIGLLSQGGNPLIFFCFCGLRRDFLPIFLAASLPFLSDFSTDNMDFLPYLPRLWANGH